MEIIPGILEKNWEEIERKISLVMPFAKSIHIDFIDGKFASNTTFLDPAPFAKYSKDPSASSGKTLIFEAHLMVEEPIKYLKPFADAGFKRFLGHIEKMSDQVEFVAQGQLLGEVGLAVDGPTSLESVKVPFDDLDCVLIMTIKAGEAGQVFVPEYLKKVQMLKQSMKQVQDMVQDDPSTGSGQAAIEVDGGINDKTIVQARGSGSSRFIANSFLFNSPNPHERYELLEKQLQF